MNYQLTFELANDSEKLLQLVDDRLIKNNFIKDGITYLIAQSDNIRTYNDVIDKFKQIIQCVANTLAQPITINILIVLSEPNNKQTPDYDNRATGPITVKPNITK